MIPLSDLHTQDDGWLVDTEGHTFPDWERQESPTTTSIRTNITTILSRSARNLWLSSDVIHDSCAGSYDCGFALKIALSCHKLANVELLQ